MTIRRWGLIFSVGGEALAASSAKIVTKQYAVDRAKRNMTEPCKARKGTERKADAVDHELLIDVLANGNCGCAIHDVGCFAAVAQSLGFSATRIIIDQRLERHPSSSGYMKKSLANLEEALRRLLDLQQHKVVPRFPPDQNGVLVCRDVFLFLMHVPPTSYKDMLLRMSDPKTPWCEQRKLVAQRLGASKRGEVAQNQISWLRLKIEGVAQNPPNRVIAKDLEMYMPLLATGDDPDEGRKGRKMRKPPVQLWFHRYLHACVNNDSIRADKLGSIEYFRANLKKSST